MPYILLIIGLVMLIKGADFFVEAASGIAKKIGMSQLLIGLTVVAMGTSAPELFVSITAALHGHTDLALGNIVGSNIANLLLIGGVGAMCGGMQLSKDILRGFVVSLAIALLLWLVSLEGVDGSQGIGVLGGAILMFVRAMHITYIIRAKKQQETEPYDIMTSPSGQAMSLMLILGLGGLIYGSNLIITSSLDIGNALGISQRIMGLVVVAIGTSLPEMVTTVTAVRKGLYGLGVGNIIGSNIFNIGLIGGLTAIIHPITFSSETNRDILFLAISTALFVLIMYLSPAHKLTKTQGFILVLVYFAYISYSIIS